MILTCKNITVQYPNKQALKEVSLQIKKGQIYGILGHNGAGKSTLIKAIMNLCTYQGEITFGFDEKDRYQKISVQLQTTNFEEGVKVKELCQLYKDLLKSTIDIDVLLKEFDMLAFQNQYLTTLSGGEKQKVAILLTLINQPEIIIFDEITSGLDAVARRKIWDVVKRLNVEKGTTIILTSHFLEEVEYLADTVLILDQGRVKEEGTIQELIARTCGQTKQFNFLIDDSFTFTKFNYPYTIQENQVHVSYDDVTLEKDIYHNILACGGYDITITSPNFEKAFLQILGYQLDAKGAITHV